MDEGEKMLTDTADPTADKLMEDMFTKLPTIEYNRALEGACGDGRVTERILLKKFKVVDVFDQCSEAIGIV